MGRARLLFVIETRDEGGRPAPTPRAKSGTRPWSMKNQNGPVQAVLYRLPSYGYLSRAGECPPPCNGPTPQPPLLIERRERC